MAIEKLSALRNMLGIGITVKVQLGASNLKQQPKIRPTRLSLPQKHFTEYFAGVTKEPTSKCNENEKEHLIQRLENDIGFLTKSRYQQEHESLTAAITRAKQDNRGN
jgi:hypothetical protein